ncbi:MAG: helix-turn-helix transcriptional regulator [Thermodesulfobacteriota bacterium]|nr:helix-turn-helix transcriptional regulator [Thermodesulfobacteriota bacterium]
MNTQVIADKSGQPEFAVLPWNEYQQMMDQVEELHDIITVEKIIADIKSGDELYPQGLVARLVAGVNPLRVWREYRSISAVALAAKVGVSAAAISQIENGKRGVSASLLNRLATELNVDMEDLI